MRKSTRNRILTLARRLDRWAAGLRRFEAKHRPKRARRVAQSGESV